MSLIRSTQYLLDHRHRQAFEQRNPLAQSRLEGDLAAHGPFGDCGDMRLEARIVGQFVDAFLLDHGGIHVGEEQLLAAMRDRLQDDVVGAPKAARSDS